MIYQLMRRFVRLSLRVYYRRIEVDGIDHVPPSGPILLVPNHVNALVDPLLIVSELDRPVTLTAKNLLARNRLLGRAMKAAGVITFHRAEDVGKGADRRQNLKSLQQCSEVLSAAGAVCIFPEGVSHSHVSMRPFRNGPARLAVEFSRHHGSSQRLVIIPVGILYSAKHRFRTDVWLRFGAPIDPVNWLNDGSTESLSKEIRRCVGELVLEYETRRESALLHWASEIVVTSATGAPSFGQEERAVSTRFEILRRLRSGYRELLEDQPVALAELSRRVQAYHRELRRHGIAAEEVFVPMDWWRVLLFLVRELELLLVGFPLALFGAINHALPAMIVRAIAKSLSREQDHWASNSIYSGAIIFPTYYLLAITACWALLPPMWAVIYAIAIPYTGWYLLLMWDRAASTLRRTRTFFLFLLRSQLRSRLTDEGQQIIDSLRKLENELLSQSPTKNIDPAGAEPCIT